MSRNPLVALIEDADTEEYRHEVALGVLAWYEDKLEPGNPGLEQLQKIVAISRIVRILESAKLAQKAWDEERAALSFWKRMSVARQMTQEYYEEWVSNEQTRAFMDLSRVLNENNFGVEDGR